MVIRSVRQKQALGRARVHTGDSEGLYYREPVHTLLVCPHALLPACLLIPALQSASHSIVSSPPNGNGLSTELRILHVAEAFGGGVFEVVRWLAERHSASGHQVAIAYGVRPETPTDVRTAVGPHPELVVLWRDRSIKSHIHAIRSIPSLVSDWSADIVHLHSSFSTVAGAISVPRSQACVCSPHAYSFTMAKTGAIRRRSYQMVEKLAARRVDLVGAVSESEANVAREVLGVSHVTVVANGIPELDQVPLRPRGSLPRRVVAMGRAEHQRQPQACARILSSIRELAQVEWIGAGSTTDLGSIALAQSNIPMSGWVERSDAMARLAQAGVYLHYTAWDGQPLSVLEAMARDVAVVASDIPANREILGPELVCSSEQEASAKIRQLLTDRAFAAQHLGIQRARRDYYSADRMANQWLDVYRETIARKQLAGQ
jgi:glycosyltransferase involved in cell wall biosynthesis